VAEGVRRAAVGVLQCASRVLARLEGAATAYLARQRRLSEGWTPALDALLQGVPAIAQRQETCFVTATRARQSHIAGRERAGLPRWGVSMEYKVIDRCS
jgi:hypothetical protein